MLSEQTPRISSKKYWGIVTKDNTPISFDSPISLKISAQSLITFLDTTS
jgi:hypothetical protein